MCFLILDPKSFRLKHEARYCYDSSVDRFIFSEGIVIRAEQVDKPISFDMDLTSEEVSRFDSVVNNASCLVVNKKFCNILQHYSPGEVQLFDVIIKCKDCMLDTYQLVNVTQAVEGVDHERSIYRKMLNADAIGGFKRLTLRDGCMGKYKIARLAEFKSHILVTEEIKQAFEAEKITGLRFVEPEKYYAEIYPGYARW